MCDSRAAILSNHANSFSIPPEPQESSIAQQAYTFRLAWGLFTHYTGTGRYRTIWRRLYHLRDGAIWPSMRSINSRLDSRKESALTAHECANLPQPQQHCSNLRSPHGGLTNYKCEEMTSLRLLCCKQLDSQRSTEARSMVNGTRRTLPTIEQTSA